MNRRRFLSFLGLAPVAAAVPAMALPRPEKPTEVRSAGYFTYAAASVTKAVRNIPTTDQSMIRD